MPISLPFGASEADVVSSCRNVRRVLITSRWGSLRDALLFEGHHKREVPFDGRRESEVSFDGRRESEVPFEGRRMREVPFDGRRKCEVAFG